MPDYLKDRQEISLKINKIMNEKKLKTSFSLMQKKLIH